MAEIFNEPQEPLKKVNKETGDINYIYPLTTDKQVKMSDGRRLSALIAEIKDTIPMSKGGTGATDGATGLRNLLAAGQTVLSENQYGETLPMSASVGTLFLKKATGTLTDMDTNLVSELMLKMYPVGSIYMSINEISPASLFGGTWERIQDRFLLAAGDAYSAGSTGGEAEHTLTSEEVPKTSVAAEQYINAGSANKGNCWTGDTQFMMAVGRNAPSTNFADLTSASAIGVYPLKVQGGGQPHNNMPPYLAVYMWKRVA